MVILTVCLFGHFQVFIAQQPVNGFKSDKARALLAFLIVEPNRPHSRSMLAGLLWPDLPQESANANLRSVLSNLRKIFRQNAPTAPPLLITDHHSVQLNPAIEVDCDLHNFRSQVAIGDLTQAAGTYSGPLLEGFSIGSEPFDDWLQIYTEAIHQEMLQALHTLTTECIYRGEFNKAMEYAHRHLALEPASEEAYQQVIYLLGLTGQRSAALAQFKQCKRMLRKELSVEPSANTNKLVRAIRDGETLSRPVIPPSLRPASQSHQLQMVARENELDWMEARLNAALASQGSTIFITGEAGSGKTSLVEALMIRALNSHPRLLTLKGSCTIHDGAGAPYLPFREILLMLTNTSEPVWGRSPLDLQAAGRIQETRGVIGNLLGEQVPDLNLLKENKPFEARKIPENRLFEAVMQHGSLFEQFAVFLQILSKDFPLVLVIDDLQWADEESLYLFQYLARKLAGQTILMVGVFRSEEIFHEDAPKRLSLETLVNELKLSFGSIVLDLNQSNGEVFAEAYLNRFANHFDDEFRKALYQHTSGHALFTSEIIDGLQSRGDLYQDLSGFWVNRPHLNWSRLPAKVEAVAAERISRLPAFWKSALAAASVEGEQFTAEALALVTGAKDQAIIQGLSRVVGRQHGLVIPQGTRVIGGRYFSLYRFRHSIFQQYLYQQMDEAERYVLHEAVANALELLYKENKPELNLLAPTLAWHYAKARDDRKALEYYALAGSTAFRMSAMHEAARHFNSALEMLDRLPPDENTNRLELDFLKNLDSAYLALYGWGSQEQERCLERMVQTAVRAGSIDDQLWTISQKAHNSMGQNQYAQAHETGKELIRLAEAKGKTKFITTGRILQGQGLVLRGRLNQGLAALEQALEHIARYPDDIVENDIHSDSKTARVYLSMALLYMGFIDQALAEIDTLLEEMRANPSLTLLGFGLIGAGITNSIILGDVKSAGRYIDELKALVEKGEYILYQPWALIATGWRETQLGRRESGLYNIREGLKACGGRIDQMGHPFLIATAGDTLAHLGYPAEGEALLDQIMEAFQSSFQVNAMYPYLMCLKGNLLQRGRDHAGSASAYLEGIRVAREQEAHLWELLAATGLCRLRVATGQAEEGYRLLRGVYDSFQEGLDTAPLLAARDALAEAAGQFKPDSDRSGNLPL